MKIGVVSDLTGGADICAPVTDLASLQALAFLAPSEGALLALSSAKEEYTFTNEALVTVTGASAMSTKRTVQRYEYQTHHLHALRFETCGVTDRDCELKFAMGRQEFSIDIAKAEQTTAQFYYRVLSELSRAQEEHLRQWDFAKLALDASVRATTVQDTSGGGKLLVEQTNALQEWYHTTFSTTNPRCYKSVLETALQRASST
ncbi:hypothetical protein Poli38472_011903 [Pythium oligandrum]|uniref:Bacterial Pleckstrin homology domain-containing protein n=1 Tax=Pythium oligandrum TaxID=41045 RepID=A0A8K1C8B1_PYTOL|nr:hypothetical protein Poli38472_011903 [Pythium oligandrum]|eukprot:TMW58315.1 hypothetical protein Poli38472_011903 [Pythium oligandrum]